MLSRLLVMPFLAAAAVPAQELCFAEGSVSSLTIVSVPESNPAAAGTTVLQQVELLPIEITGRYLGQQHDVRRSRRIENAAIVRVELPQNGRLLRYRRAGGLAYGFLHIAADGTPRVVLEQPGVAGADPFEDRIGVARDGGHFAVPVLAGGLFLVRLDGQNYASTGTPARLVAGQLPVEALSVMVSDQVVWFQSELLGVYRCSLADNATPVDVSPPPQAGAILKEQMAMSGDGGRIVFLYGPQQQQTLWTATLATGAQPLPPAPSKYEDPNYLPEGTGSPALLLNEDGSRLFYVDADIRDELFLLDTSGVLPTLHITDDPVFQPYIGVHILPGYLADVLTISIGDLNQMDWFRAELTAQGGTVENLSGTGSLLQPFPAGQIDPTDGFDLGTGRLLSETVAGQKQLRVLDPLSGQAPVILGQLAGPLRSGQSTGISADLVAPTANGDVLLAGSSLLLAPQGLTLGAPVTGPLYRALPLGGNGWAVPTFYLPDGTLLLGGIENAIDQICLTTSGGAVVVGSTLHYFAPGVSVVLNRPTVPFRRCLSGAGV
ncbi:MAG TPA: hypothetical protein ENI87_01165 [bacterium]|nr:hypothetical protein [bacterium]